MMNLWVVRRLRIQNLGDSVNNQRYNMIPESLSNRVYFSALLPEVCPVTYSGLVEILDRYGVPHSLLEGTKDIWCRDYMPIQTIDNRFVLFRYEPDYLLDTAKHKASITDNTIAGRYVGSSYLEDSRGIKVQTHPEGSFRERT